MVMMNRRNFLFLHRTPRGRVLELSCRDLYMRALNVEPATTASEETIFEYEPWMGEPPNDFARTSDESWLTQIERQLQDVDILTLLDEEWLDSGGLADQLEPLLGTFRQRGGKVEFGRTTE